MKILLSSLLSLVCAASLAAPRTYTEARQVAEQALSHRLQRSVTLRTTPLRAAQRPDDEAVPLPYYQFSDTESGAFVIVAGSDLLPAVIGYGEQWSTTDDALSPNLQSWLAQVEEAERYLESHPEAAQQQAEALAQGNSCQPIAPILPCRWGQTAPFNSFCPGTSSRQYPVGCMATAMSQIMYSQRWPTQSFGELSYRNRGVPMTVTLEGLTYDYNLMLDAYNDREYTEEQRDAVARLCYYVGAASKMQYGQSSGTIELETIDGMRRHFGMTEAALIYRHYYSLAEWNDVLQAQLREGLPILYTGQSTAGGHAFVLDGLDTQGFYHVNWGWEGQGDGYFDITILHTDMIGTGASANDGFNIENQALMNLCNPTKAHRWHCPLGTYRTTGFSEYDQIWCRYEGTLTRGTTLNFETYPINSSFMPVRGRVGIRVTRGGQDYDLALSEDGVLEVGASIGSVDASGNFTWWPTDTEVHCSYTIPADIEDGTYLLYLVMQPEGATWVDAIRQYNYSPSYWTLTVSGEELRLSHTRQASEEPSVAAVTTVNTDAQRPTTRAFNLMGQPRQLSADAPLVPGLYVVDGQLRLQQ